jgi:hypothetical protein
VSTAGASPELVVDAQAPMHTASKKRGKEEKNFMPPSLIA